MTPEKRDFENKKLEKRLCREVGRAIVDYNMIEEGDRVMVCLSGGKDSYGLLDILMKLQKRAPVNFELIAVNLDQKQPGFPDHILPEYLSKLGIKFHIETQDTYSIVKEKIEPGKTMCSLCSRLRRGILYRVAREEGCEAIVLGHHRDDALETFMMNLVHGGRLAAMPPKLLNDEGDVMVFRPLITSAEADLAKFAEAMAFPIIPCNLCGSQDGLQRVAMKHLLDEWERKKPGVRQTMARALANVRPSHLHDGRVFDFATLGLGGSGEDDPNVPF
jgi:tRNA 2-thiocytidine biosynthesis protein TtcA